MKEIRYPCCGDKLPLEFLNKLNHARFPMRKQVPAWNDNEVDSIDLVDTVVKRLISSVIQRLKSYTADLRDLMIME